MSEINTIMSQAASICKQRYGVGIHWQIIPLTTTDREYTIPVSYIDLFMKVCEVYNVPFEDFKQSLLMKGLKGMRKRKFTDIKMCLCKILRDKYTLDYSHIGKLLNYSDHVSPLTFCKKYEWLLTYEQSTIENYKLILKYLEKQAFEKN